jgi:hypothetical protein
MLVARVRQQGGWHYSDLEREIVDDIRLGRAVLLFDLSNEGHAHSHSVFAELFEWIEANSLPEGRVIWLSQNRKIQLDVEEEFHGRTRLVQFINFDFFVRLMAWLFCQKGPNQLLSHEDQENLLSHSADRRLLTCLNATPRLHRVLTVAALRYHNLVENSFVSFPGLNYEKRGAASNQICAFLEKYPQLSYLSKEIDYLAHIPPLKVDLFEEKGNQLVTKIDLSVYKKSFFSVVTETDFGNNRVDRVTEKIAKAYSVGHPVITIGNAHLHRFMLELGFQSWSHLIDETYNSIPDHVERFEAVLAEILRQVEKIRSNPTRWLAEAREVSAFNLQHAGSGRFFECYKDLYDAPLIEYLNTLLSARAT